MSDTTPKPEPITTVGELIRRLSAFPEDHRVGIPTDLLYFPDRKIRAGISPVAGAVVTTREDEPVLMLVAYGSMDGIILMGERPQEPDPVRREPLERA